MKIILAAIALLAVSTAAQAQTQYVIVSFDKAFSKSKVIEEFRDLDDYETCIDAAVSSDEGEWTACVPVTGLAEGYIMMNPIPVWSPDACLLASVSPTDINLEACTGIPVEEAMHHD